MNTPISLFIIVALASGSGCSENSSPGEPLEIRNYFAFVDTEGGDFFESDPRYAVDKVTMNCYYIEAVKMINGFHTYQAFPRECESLINFGNGDVDTLKVAWEDGLIGRLDKGEILRKATFFFNGKIIATWDFEANTSLLGELGNRNVPDNINASTTSPIIIMLPKTADEGELD